MRKIIPHITNGILSKICTKCKKDKPVEEFNKTGKSIGSEYRSQCKICQNKENIIYTHNNLEKERTRKILLKDKFKNFNIKYGIQIAFKLCPACKQNKSSDLFSKSINEPDCLFWRCATCQSAYEKEYRCKNKEKETLRHQKYQATPIAIKKARARMSRRRSDYETKSINEMFENSEFHHLHLRINNGDVDNSFGLYIPEQIHQTIRHHPATSAKPKRHNMNEIASASFTWFLDHGLSTINTNSEMGENLNKLIAAGKNAKLENIPKKYRSAHFEGIAKLEAILTNTNN
jgi:hypothetical protein